MIRLKSIVALPVLLALQATPAAAQAVRTWVSNSGDDINPCSLTAPCRTFSGAISKTSTGGEINALNNGTYGAVTITKAITINMEYNEAGVTAGGTNGITVNAGPNDVVVLRGLDINGAQGSAPSPGLNGIRFVGGAALHVEKCLIRNFGGASPDGFGILFAPGGVSQLFVSDTTITNNGNVGATTGGGIGVVPGGSGNARVRIENVRLDGNRLGLLVQSTSATATAAVTVDASSLSGNDSAGLAVLSLPSGGMLFSAMVNRATIVNNAVGLNAWGPVSTIRLGNSVLTANYEAAGMSNGGQVLSYQTNMINGNGNDGTPLKQLNLN
jgi:hypothetical protein